LKAFFLWVNAEVGRGMMMNEIINMSQTTDGKIERERNIKKNQKMVLVFHA